MSDTNTNEQPKWVNNSDAKMAEPLEVNANGGWVYPAQLKEGFEETEIPAPPGSLNATERLHMKDFGGMVISKIESSMNTRYLRKHSPAQVFRHYATVAKGSELMDIGAIGRMEEIAKEFEQTPMKAEYYEMVVRPWLLTLAPKRR